MDDERWENLEKELKELFSEQFTVLSAGASRGSWTARYLPLVVCIVLLLAGVLGAWATVSHQQQEIRGYLLELHQLRAKVAEYQAEARIKDVAHAKEVERLVQRSAAAEARMTERRIKYQDARKILDREFVPPTDSAELVRRLGALGLAAEVKR